MSGEGNRIGMVATSLSGRDKGRSFLVVTQIDDNHVGLADGMLRKLSKPKKKKLKHLEFHDVLAEGIRAKLIDAKPVFDAEIRKYLLTLEFNREKISKEE